MGNSFDTVKRAFEQRSPNRLPRGELWLGTDLLRKADLEDNLEGLLALVKRLGQDARKHWLLIPRLIQDSMVRRNDADNTSDQ